MSESAHPQGFNPADEAAMRTEAEQSAGGTQAAAVGQGGLLGARTRNKGAAAQAVADASRGAGQQLSNAGLRVQTENADLKNQQRAQALSGLTGLTGMETGASNNALGEVAGNVNADTNARKASYDWTSLLSPVTAAVSRPY
jgi:hypothetical protein